MYFSRISMNLEGFNPGKAARILHGSVYNEHKLLWEFFPEDKDAKRDFLYRRYDLGRVPQYFILSQRKPRCDREIWDIETKSYDPVIREGEQYSFSLRVNPVVTKMPMGRESKKRKRDDVYMEALAKSKALPQQERLSNNEIMIESGLQWIMDRAERHGFSLNKNQVIVEGYYRMDGFKDGDKNRIQFGAMDFSGILTVKDGELFRQTLMHGIGKAKAFGCGMLLLIRV